MWNKIGFKRWRKYLWILFLWIMFTFGCFLAPFLAMMIPFTRREYIVRFVKAADRMLAAMLNYSGRNMLSTELAHDTSFKWMHDMLNEIDENHCEESAYAEGAYCRLSDRRLGIR